MKMNTFAIGALAPLLVTALVACDPGDTRRTTQDDGRTRLSSNKSHAEFGDYVIHVNGMTTASLSPEVAQSYGIQRSEEIGMFNLVILKKATGPQTDQPVSGDVTVSAANLTGQLKNIEVREIRDGTAIYYIGEVSVDDRETINFDFDVTPEGSDGTLLVRFSHQFYTG